MTTSEAAEAWLSQQGGTFCDRAEADHREGAALRGLLSPAQRKELNAALAATVVAGKEFFAKTPTP